MRRSSGHPWRWSAAAAMLVLAVTAAPARAGNPQVVVIGGGDDPEVTIAQTAGDIEINRWKAAEADRLRDALRAAPAGRGGPRPLYPVPPCWNDCPPSEFALRSYARKQATWYFCGPAVAQVVINRTRDIYVRDPDGQDPATNYRTQSVIAGFMGTGVNGTNAWMLKSALNQYADLGASGRTVSFTVVDDIASGSEFHSAMILATWSLQRGAAVPVQMTYSSQHLASWTSSTWWSSHRSEVVRHWISIYGYAGQWDGSYGPQLYLTDSSGGYGGRTGAFQNASRLVYNLNQANSGRIVY